MVVRNLEGQQLGSGFDRPRQAGQEGELKSIGQRVIQCVCPRDKNGTEKKRDWVRVKVWRVGRQIT